MKYSMNMALSRELQFAAGNGIFRRDGSGRCRNSHIAGTHLPGLDKNTLKWLPLESELSWKLE